MNGMSEGKVVYIGRKPVMSYVLATLTNLQQKGSNDVILRARGRAISTAVDTAEVTRRYFNKELNAAVSIGTEELAQEEGGTRNVSTMEIVLTKGDPAPETSEKEEEPQVTEKIEDKSKEAGKENTPDVE
jgi:DNA-binding protein